MSARIRQTYEHAINRLAKWRLTLAGWQLGTRANTDPECQAVRDQREALLLLRVEVTALSALLIEKGIITADDFMQQVTIECAHMEAHLEKKFPGFKSSPEGMVITPEIAARTMKGWRP